MPLSQWFPGQTRRWRAPCLPVALWALFATGLWGCGAGAPMFAAQSPDASALPVLAAEVTQRTVPIYEEFVARTQGIHTVELRARVEGFLEQVRFREGSLVQQSQVLFVIEPRPYEAALLSARAQLAQAQADLMRAQEQVEVRRARAELARQRATLAKARQEVARLRPLVPDRAVPQQDFDTALAAEQVAAAYFQLRELDPQLEIARRTLESRRASLRLVRTREEGGVASLLEVRQAETLLYTAATVIPGVERRIAQTENPISAPVGRNPGAIPRGRPLLQQLALPEVPPGLPSALLERRPDIRQAEQQLVSANVQIGVASALLFPQVALTGSAGVGTVGVGGTFFSPRGLFAIGPLLTAPIVNSGQIRANVAASEAQQQAALWRNLQSIQQAFREVSDALVEYRKQREFRVQQEALTRTWQDALRLANERYEGAITSFLEVLDTQREPFSAELTLAQAQLAERLAAVRLYRAFGGGWQL